MADFDARAPVLVGVGEASGKLLGAKQLTPVGLAGAAIRCALDDSGQAEPLGAAVDCIAAIRLFEDSHMAQGTGSPDNVPEAYGAAAGISAERLIYCDLGGQSPQAILSELAGDLHRGEIRAVLIVGAEAIRTAKRAGKAGVKLDWSKRSDTPVDDRLAKFPILAKTEWHNGIVSMPLAYGLIEKARAIRLGLGVGAYSREMASLWSSFAAKSLTREHAQYPKGWSADDLLADNDGNYQLTSMYRRWMVAQDGVDMAAAVIMTTAGMAHELGISDDRMVWLAGAADAYEPPLCERPNISGSDALQYAMTAALDQAGVAPSELGPVDIYSCFPCAVFAAIDALGDPSRAPGDYTLTGGLSFFGGPGNNYSLHALAAMVQALRADGGKPAMITANGGTMSKQSVGIYTAQQPAEAWSGEAAKGYRSRPLQLNETPDGNAHILSYTQALAKGESGPVSLLLEMENGARAMAMLGGNSGGELAGRNVIVSAGERQHTATLA